MSILTWLHISDLHLGEKTHDWEAVREALLTDIKEHQDPATAKDPPCAGRVLKPDLIFITGDLTDKGKRHEYDLIRALLKQLWEITDLSESCTFMIPGNHDVNRSAVNGNSTYKTMRKKFSDHSLDDDRLAQELNNFWPQRGMFFKKHKAFTTVTRDLSGVGRPVTYFAKLVNLRDLPPIEVIGVNSAWMSDQDHEDTRRQLILGFPQIDEIRDMLQLKVRPIRIALLHHPFDALHPSDTSVRQLKELCPIILFGHLHRQRPFHGEEPGCEYVMIPAGAVYQKSRFAMHAYNYVQLDVDTGNVTVFLRRATAGPRPRYIRDNQTFPEGAPDGHFRWTIKRLTPTADDLDRSGREPGFHFRKIFSFVKLVRWHDREGGEDSFEEKRISVFGKQYPISVYDEAICYSHRIYQPTNKEIYPISLKSSGYITLHHVYPIPKGFDEGNYHRSSGGLMDCYLRVRGTDHMTYIWRIYNGFQRGQQDFTLTTHNCDVDELLLKIDFSSLKGQVVFQGLPKAYIWTPGEPSPGAPQKIDSEDNGWIWCAQVKRPQRRSELTIRWKLRTMGKTDDAWVFGYGSLMSPVSITRTLSDRHFTAKDLTPCTLQGYRRLWSAYRRNTARLATESGDVPDYIAYLNIQEEPDAHVNGVAFPVEVHDDLKRLDQREGAYIRVDITDKIDLQLPRGSRAFTYISVLPMPREAYEGKTVIREDYFQLMEEACRELGKNFIHEYKETTEPLKYPVMKLVDASHRERYVGKKVGEI